MKPESPTKLALFDLDHTLLPLDSDQSWGEFTLQLGWVEEAAFRQRNNAFYADYNAGCLDIHEYVRFATRSMRERSFQEAQAAHRQFMEQVIQPAIKTVALELVAQHRALGDKLGKADHDRACADSPWARSHSAKGPVEPCSV